MLSVFFFILCFVCKVVERKICMEEVMTALEEGNLVEMFGSGKNLFADFFKREATHSDTECSEKLWFFFKNC